MVAVSITQDDSSWPDDMETLDHIEAWCAMATDEKEKKELPYGIYWRCPENGDSLSWTVHCCPEVKTNVAFCYIIWRTVTAAR